MATKTLDPREVKKMAEALIEAETQYLKLSAQWVALFSASGDEEDAARGTLAERIVNLLSGRFDETFTTPQVVATLNANPNSVGPILSRLVAERKIEKVGHGEYRAKRTAPEGSTSSFNQLVDDVLGSERNRLGDDQHHPV